MKIEAVKDQDSEGLFTLVRGCFNEYPGCFLEPDSLDSDLKAYATFLAGINGEGFVVKGKAGGIVGLVSYAPVGEGEFQLKRIYLDKNLRGTGFGVKLLYHIESRVRSRGGKFIQLWSDTRFTRAHSFYEREGYIRQPETRILHDLSNTIEYQFIKSL